MLAEFYNSKFNVGSVCSVLIRYLYYNIGLTLAHLRWFIVVGLAECWHLFQWLESKCWANVKPTVGDYVGPMNKITLGQR